MEPDHQDSTGGNTGSFHPSHYSHYFTYQPQGVTVVQVILAQEKTFSDLRDFFQLLVDIYLLFILTFIFSV